MTPDPLQKQDIDHLSSLAIGFRIVGALCAICVNFAWIHVVVGLTTMLGTSLAPATTSRPNDPETAMTPIIGTAFGGIFVIVGLAVILGGYAMGFYGFKAAKALEQRRDWKLCFGVSIAFMLFQPLGLVLGILALIVLSRTSVKQAFGEVS